MDKSLLIARLFWILFTVEATGAAVFTFWASRDTRSWGPEGPVGGWLVYVVPPILLGIPLAVVLIGQSKITNLIGLYVLAWPLVPLVIGPVYSALQNYRTERSVAGDLNFLWPSQRKVAHAVQARDAALVKALLPRCGDLNAEHRGESLFAFALKNADKSAASLEIVKSMLDRGANPNLFTSNRSHVLIFAISAGPAMTELLLNAGADANLLEESGKPAWWDVLYDDSPEALQTLTILLDHGADLTRRDSEGGPVGRAAYLKQWRAVWLMMERGAAWKGEPALGQQIPAILDQDLDYRRSAHSEIPEEMWKIKAKYDAEEPRR